jgi:hypothetical protein
VRRVLALLGDSRAFVAVAREGAVARLSTRMVVYRIMDVSKLRGEEGYVCMVAEETIVWWMIISGLR